MFKKQDRSKRNSKGQFQGSVAGANKVSDVPRGPLTKEVRRGNDTTLVSTEPTLSRKEIRVKKSLEKLWAKQELERQQDQGQHAAFYGPLSPHSDHQRQYRKNKLDAESRLDRLLDACVVYNEEDNEHPEVRKLEKKIRTADDYDFLSAILVAQKPASVRKSILSYVNSTISGVSKWTMGPSIIELSSTKFGRTIEDTARQFGRLSEIYDESDGKNNEELKKNPLYSDGLFDAPWVPDKKYVETLRFIEAKCAVMQSLKGYYVDRFGSNDLLAD